MPAYLTAVIKRDKDRVQREAMEENSDTFPGDAPSTEQQTQDGGQQAVPKGGLSFTEVKHES